MDHQGILSLLPPVIAIFLAIKTRQVYLSLITGIFLGYLVLASGNPWTAFLDTLEGLVTVFADAGNTRTILFCALVGGLLILIKRSGGVEGFLQFIHHRLLKHSDNSATKVQLIAYITGLVVFVETSISALTVGSIFKPMFDKLKISREKLAYLTDSSSAPSSILIPFNAWGAFIMGLLMADGFTDPFGAMIKALPYNFYPILTVVIAFIVIGRNWNIGPMRQAEQMAKISEGIPSGQSAELNQDDWMDTPVIPGIQPKSRNMLLPLGTMILSMPIILVYTGWEIISIEPNLSLGQKIFGAMGAGSGSKAVLTAVVLSLLVAAFLYKVSGIMRIKEWMEYTLKGSAAMLPLATLMLLAFAIGDICRLLGTGPFVASIASSWLNPALLPALVFLATSFIAFSTGTSWGTFAIMMAIALPISADLGANTSMVIAAVLGGGVFGDHCSPISDTTIISSLASGSEHIAHVRTQLPYALVAGGLSTGLYIFLGLMQQL